MKKTLWLFRESKRNSGRMLLRSSSFRQIVSGGVGVLNFGWLRQKVSHIEPVSGSSSAVERQLPKLDVAGSIPVSRSSFSIGAVARGAQPKINLVDREWCRPCP